MAYQATILSRITQFGTTQIIAEFVDNQGVMPRRVATRVWNKENVTNPELIVARNEVIAQLTAEYDELTEKNSNMTTFKEKLTQYLDTKILEITEQYLADLQNYNLNEKQIAIALKVRFKWEV